MAQQTLENGLSGLEFRTRLNSNFNELYHKANHCLGHYDTLADLQTAHPTANAGDWAIVTNPSSPTKPLIYLWDAETSAWVVSGTSVFVSSFNSRTGDITPLVGDYSSFYDALGAAASAVSAHNLAYDHTKIHDAATAGTGISILGQVITNSDTGSGAVSAHNLAYDHGLIHSQNGDLYLGTQITREVFVDKGRGDTYTATGSITKPYKTIQAAIDYIASVAVAGQDWTVRISTGQYVENLVLESTGLHSIALEGNGVVGIIPVSGNSLQSITNNQNLVKFRIRNIEFTRPVVITGLNGGTNYNDVWLTDCKFVTNASLTLNCINNFSLTNSYVETAVTLTNIPWFFAGNTQIQGAFTMICDSTLPAPSGGYDGTCSIEGSYCMGAVTLTKGGTAIGVLVATGSRMNSSSGTIVSPAGWTVQLYGSHFRGNFTNGGTLQLRTGFIGGTLTSTGTLALDQAASQIKNVPAGTISATTVQAAIDELDSEKTTLSAVKADTDVASAISLKHDAATAGTGISILGQVITCTVSPYTLPTASTGTLGGIKVGTLLSIDGAGVLSATRQVPASSLIYPPAYSLAYVVSTSAPSGSDYAYQAFDHTRSLSGNWDQGWLFINGSKQERLNVDMGVAKLITGFYYENGHNSGNNTDLGLRAFTMYGSNDVNDFNNTSYASVGNWVQLTTDISEFVRHSAVNGSDPRYCYVTTSTLYRYYSFKFSSNWGTDTYMSLRRLSLQSVVYYTHPNHTGDVTSVGDGALTITNESVTLAKMAKMNTVSLLGNFTSNLITTGLPTVIDASTLRANSEDMPASRISVYPVVHDTTTVKATSSYATYLAPQYQPWNVTNPANPLNGGWENQWCSDNQPTNQRFHIDLNTAQTIVGFYYENGHHNGLEAHRGGGVKNFTLWGSNDAGAFATLTYSVDTNWTQLSTNATMFMPHAAVNRSDPRYISVIGAGSYRYYAFKFADNWNSAYFMELRRIEFRVVDPVVSAYTLPVATNSVLGGVKQGSRTTIDVNGVISASGDGIAPLILGYSPAHNSTYVKSTTNDGTYDPFYATDPAKSLTGSGSYNSWLSLNPGHTTNERFHIDMGAEVFVGGVYYENCHVDVNTNNGARAFTMWGSNNATAFATLTYGTDTNWTQLTTSVSEFDRHAEGGGTDPKYFTVTSTLKYRYYAFKIANNWGGSYAIGLRRISLQKYDYYTHPNHTGDVTSVGDGALTIGAGKVTLAMQANMAGDSLLGLISNAVGTPAVLGMMAVRNQLAIHNPVSLNYPVAHSSTYVKSTTTEGSYEPYLATDPAKLLTGSATSNSWLSLDTNPTNQRFHIDLGTSMIVAGFYYEPFHDSGTATDMGVQNFTLWGSNDPTAFATLTYGTDTNWTQLTTGVSRFARHADSNVAEPHFCSVDNHVAYRYYAFKFANNWGHSRYMGVRRLVLQSDVHAIDGTMHTGILAASQLPVATDIALGGIKVGATLSISSGVLSSNVPNPTGWRQLLVSSASAPPDIWQTLDNPGPGGDGYVLTYHTGTPGFVGWSAAGPGSGVFDSSAFIYLGGITTAGSWRIGRSGNDLVMQRYESSVWVTKLTATA